MNIEARLHELGLQLPTPPKPAGNYQPWRVAGHLLFLSGQFPIENGQLRHTGQVGADLTEADGYAAASLAAVNVLAQIHSALDGFDRLETLARVKAMSPAPLAGSMHPASWTAHPTCLSPCWREREQSKRAVIAPRTF
jgi:hypothetical protein